ncbi:coiled-coil domain-containing protein [Rathayibacter sp. KR2-224]|uniref:coiled-coil domain-containing protein n=1 Tax=Rathayibacter sp. KR2-224 TaxID=3400913 RepID=UPI003C078AB8
MAVRRDWTLADRSSVGARVRLLVLGAVVAVAIPLLAAAPAHADDYPSWDEVQAAKANAAAAQAEYNKITGLITQLQQAADAAATDQLKKEFEYTEAKNALDAQTTRLGSINQQVATAQKDATQAKNQYGKIASQLYISGGGSLTAKLFLSQGRNDDLLDQLGSMSQLTGHISQLQSYAQQKQNVVTSLQAQAKQAEDIRTTLEQDADAKYKAAQAAKAAADAALAAQQAQGAVLQAQAASLNASAAAEEQQYWVGYNIRQNQAKTSNASSGSNSTIDTSAGCSAGCSPSAAQAYARGAIGAYGWGDDQFSCLVQLWTMESGWRWNAYNSDSAAYGIPQSWPGSKMSSAGADWQTNGDTQINWGLRYIAGSYGTPCGAWTFEMSHTPHWY